MFKKIIYILGFVLGITFFNFVSADSLDDVMGENSTAGDYQVVSQNISSGTVNKWVHNTMKMMLKITVMIGIAVFLYGGIRFLLSMGDDSKAKKTRDTLLVSGLGFIIAFGAWIILELIMSVGTTILR